MKHDTELFFCQITLHTLAIIHASVDHVLCCECKVRFCLLNPFITICDMGDLMEMWWIVLCWINTSLSVCCFFAVHIVFCQFFFVCYDMLCHLVHFDSPLFLPRNIWSEVEENSHFAADVTFSVQSFGERPVYGPKSVTSAAKIQNSWQSSTSLQQFLSQTNGTKWCNMFNYFKHKEKWTENNINCKKATYRWRSYIYLTVQSTIFPLDHPPHRWLWLGLTNQITPYTLRKKVERNGQLRHVSLAFCQWTPLIFF